MRPIHIEGGRALIDGAFTETTLTLEDGVIAALGDFRPSGALVFDAAGLLVLPGIVDIHGDAFERQIMPRPGVRFAYPIALADTDRQLAAAGITTAYHGLTLSWEPGLRSVEFARDFMEALAEARPSLAIDHRVQLRAEAFAFEAVDDIIRWLQVDPKPALAFNDHTSDTVRKLADGRQDQLSEWARRSGLSEESYLDLFEQIRLRTPEVEASVEHVAEQARQAGAIMLSHDDKTADDRQYYRNLGAGIAEFPMTREAIEEAAGQSEPAVLGAPNVVRGGSHNGALTAVDMIEAGLCTILASDYHYPSMLAAIACLVEDRGMPLEKAWSLLSKAPATALELEDRGSVERGRRGDLVLVQMGDGRPPRVVATLTAGRLAFLAGEARIV